MERDSFRNVKWFVLAYFVLLILILTLIGVFGQLGYAFIDMGLAVVPVAAAFAGSLAGAAAALMVPASVFQIILLCCLLSILEYLLEQTKVVVQTNTVSRKS